ncbi:MAG: hypothetical protein ACRD10_07630, partial [Terriglobia bacterium]
NNSYLGSTTKPALHAARTRRWVAAVAMVLLLACVAEARSSKNRERPQNLPDRIDRLARQLEGVRVYDAGLISNQIQTLVLGSLAAWISRNVSSDAAFQYPLEVRVRRQLEQDFSDLHYPLFGRPAVFVRSWKGGELIGAGYTLGWSDFDRVNTLALFNASAGASRLAAVTNFVSGTDLHYGFLPPSASGDFRLLVYGNRLGKSQPRLTVALYVFDGKSLRQVWQRQDLYQGKLRFTPQSVTLTYLIEGEYIQAVQQGQLPPRHEAIYRIAPGGLTLETERLIAFSAIR